VDVALRDISDLYYFGDLFVLLPPAAFLGVVSISGEVSNGSIFLLLSRPISRIRLLLTKYAVGAGVLLAAAILGKVLLLAVAAVHGYPLGEMRVLEAVLSVLVVGRIVRPRDGAANLEHLPEHYGKPLGLCSDPVSNLRASVNSYEVLPFRVSLGVVLVVGTVHVLNAYLLLLR
jgi:hypothetical protein